MLVPDVMPASSQSIKDENPFIISCAKFKSQCLDCKAVSQAIRIHPFPHLFIQWD